MARHICTLSIYHLQKLKQLQQAWAVEESQIAAAMPKPEEPPPLESLKEVEPEQMTML
jgi:hypothetical protein